MIRFFKNNTPSVILGLILTLLAVFIYKEFIIYHSATDFTLTALQNASSRAKGTEITLTAIEVDGTRLSPLAIIHGTGLWKNPPGEVDCLNWNSYTEGLQPVIHGTIPEGRSRKLQFVANKWSGRVRLTIGGSSRTLDLYSDIEFSVKDVQFDQVYTLKTLIKSIFIYIVITSFLLIFRHTINTSTRSIINFLDTTVKNKIFFIKIMENRKALSLFGVVSFWVLIIFFACSCYLAQFFYPIYWSDYPIWLATAQEIVNGKTCYADIWDNKGPALLYFYALALWFGNGSIYYTYAFNCIVAVCALFILYKASRRLLPPVWATLACFFYALPQLRVFHGVGGFSQCLALPFHALCVYLFLSYYGNKQDKRFLLLCYGASCSIVFLIQPNLITPWIYGGFLWFIIDVLIKKMPGILLKKIALCSIAFFSVISISILYFLYKDALYAFYDGLFGFNFFEYRKAIGLSLNLIQQAILSSLRPMAPLHFLLSFALPLRIILGFLCKSNLEQKTSKNVYIGLLGWFFVEQVASSLSGHNYAHYFGSLLIPMSLFLTILLWDCYLLLSFKKIYLPVIAAVIILIIVQSYPIAKEHILHIHTMATRTDRPIDQLTNLINKYSNPGDVVIGSDCFICFAVFHTKRTYGLKYSIYWLRNRFKPDFQRALFEKPQIVFVKDVWDMKNEDPELFLFLTENYTHVSKEFDQDCWVLKGTVTP